MTEDRAAIKAKLLRQMARPQPSLLEIQPLVAALQSPWSRPEGDAFVAALAGLWELRFTTAGALSRLGLDALPGVVRSRTYQYIEPTGDTLYNLAQLTLLGGLAQGTLLVKARLDLQAPVRVHVHFERSSFVWGGIDEFGTAEAAIRRISGGEGVGPRLDVTSDGFVDVLYLDEDLRIALGNRGTLFILTRS